MIEEDLIKVLLLLNEARLRIIYLNMNDDDDTLKKVIEFYNNVLKKLRTYS